MEYDNNKIKDLITKGPTEQSSEFPEYALECVKRRNLENSEEELVEKAIDVAARAMDDPDIKLALDGANKAMTWLGKTAKSKNTTVIAKNAQINQITENPKTADAILDALPDITMLTQGVITEDGQINE